MSKELSAVSPQPACRTVPRKVRHVPGTRSDGRAYQSAPTDGRRVRWQRGAGRVQVTCRRWVRLEAALLARDFAPPSLALEYHAAFVRRVRALLESVFTTPDTAAARRRERLPLAAAEFHALRAELNAKLRAVRPFTTRERRLIGQRVRDWLNRNFTVQETTASDATREGITP